MNKNLLAEYIVRSPLAVHCVDGSTKSNNNNISCHSDKFQEKNAIYMIIMTNTLSLSNLKILRLTMHAVVCILQTFYGS